MKLKLFLFLEINNLSNLFVIKGRLF